MTYPALVDDRLPDSGTRSTIGSYLAEFPARRLSLRKTGGEARSRDDWPKRSRGEALLRCRCSGSLQRPSSGGLHVS